MRHREGYALEQGCTLPAHAQRQQAVLAAIVAQEAADARPLPRIEDLRAAGEQLLVALGRHAGDAHRRVVGVVEGDLQVVGRDVAHDVVDDRDEAIQLRRAQRVREELPIQAAAQVAVIDRDFGVRGSSVARA